ncbi:ubiquitin-specific protease [Coprinopsis sp. MPI-PUGE-AT-0042]|nr:ubiquitin-specific protease [Coprinopsis sp. MPI-PUGE-AT-0042]
MSSLQQSPSSTSLNPSDSTQQPSRKRQRSRSMQSDTSSSSPKRAMSEGVSHESVRSPNPDQMSHLTLADTNQDIDAYMAEQGEAEIPPTLSLGPPEDNATWETMPASDKWSWVKEEKGKSLKEGDTWYLVAQEWWKRWARACGGLVDKQDPVPESEVGPVDNSPLFDPSGGLKPGVIEGVDYELVPSEVWIRFISWYGAAAQPLPRRVIDRGIFSSMTVVELYPPQIKVLRLCREAPQDSTAGQLHPRIEVSAGETVKDLCTKVANAVKIGQTLDTPYRVWRPTTIPEDWKSIDFPATSLKEADAKIIDESDEKLSTLNIEVDDAFVVEFKQANGWLVDATDKKEPGSEAPKPLFKSQDAFFNRFMTTVGSKTPAKTESTFSSGFNAAKTPFSLNKSYSKSLEPGALGLGNMGNTCFMNSALQCLAHTKELTEYFINGVFKTELNRDNPLGMQGAIAEVFGSLLERIWASSGTSTSYSPREFKQTLQRFAPQFSGYQQHDSQELVAFLLDGLHEDLNRVLKKPYVEKPDWEGGGDLELVQLATKSWDGYMLRNDSVIVDLFQGQYQSTLVCPECSKISITFDPFMYLTLPIPVQKKWKHTIYFIPWDLEERHIKVPIEINRDASFKDLRALFGRWVEAVPENLLMLEIFHHKFYKVLEDHLPVTEMGESDTIVCFELPCNARMSRTYKKKEDDPFIVPLFLCDAKSRNTFSSYGVKSVQLFGYPCIVVVDKEQAKSEDAIYDAVVGRLQRWTVNANHLYDWEVGPDSEDAALPIPIRGLPPMESLTEITPDGEVVNVDPPAEETDIVDEKNMLVDEEEAVPTTESNPRPYRTKKDVFNLKIYTNQKEYGAGYSMYAKSEEWATWAQRKEEQSKQPVLLRELDALYAEFDENMKAYFFGEPRHFENARWDQWEDYVHPELEAMKKNESAKKKQGISLQDCLDEFVKEEQLGEDDLWYCPSCKKHQQATKKFDLWKAPDILVVHLKRFSNNRTLRDKIDTFVDFPIDGLDLSDKVGERLVAERLKKDGIELEELKSVNLDEPLVYDLFGVDEHMGGLGGGHYRAYASNHLNGKWYHFDDAYVTTAKAENAVNASAYLLFYRRRSSQPLGGENYQKAMEKKPDAEDEKPAESSSIAIADDSGLPTPPSDGEGPFIGPLDRLSPSSSSRPLADYWNHDSIDPIHLSDDEPPPFEDAHSDPLIPDTYESFSYDSSRMLMMSNYRRESPSSSNEADDGDGTEGLWSSRLAERFDDSSPVPEWEDDKYSTTHLPSPSRSGSSRTTPFEDEIKDVDLDSGDDELADKEDGDQKDTLKQT